MKQIFRIHCHQQNLLIVALLLLSFQLGCQTAKPAKEGVKKEATIAVQAPVFSQLKSLEVAETKLVQKVSFGSCLDQKNEEPILKQIIKQKSDLFLAIGDNVYGSGPDDRPIAKIYEAQARKPEYREFRSRVPQYGVWDDHDYGTNDGGADHSDKHNARAAYLAFFPLDQKRIAPEQNGIYHSLWFGPANQRLQILFLDTRWFRSSLELDLTSKSKKYLPSQDRNKTILGKEQWDWLEQELQIPAQFRIIVSSIQLIPAEHNYEKWANFPYERQRFFDLLSKHRINNAIILSGDRHLSEISQLRIPEIGNLVEVTSSSLNRPGSITDEKNSARIGDLYNRENFGLIHLNWKRKEVKIELRDLKGKVIHSVKRNFTE